MPAKLLSSIIPTSLNPARLIPFNLPMLHNKAEADQSYISKTYQNLSLAMDNAILTITLQRPDKKNAMSFAMIRELLDVAEQIKQDRKLRAVIITGSEETFCAGIDLSDLNNPKNRAFAVWELIRPGQSFYQQVCLVWQDMPVPVIAAIEGYCIGAGLQLALGCDIRIAAPNSKLAIMEAKWGLVPDMGLAKSSLGVVRADVLKELAMTARLVDADEALKLGLVTHLNESPYTQAKALCAEMVARSPDAVLASKRMINQRYPHSYTTLYLEKMWQLKMMLGRNRKYAVKKVKDDSVSYAKRQFN